MKKRLINLGIISVSKNTYLRGTQCKRYSISLDKLYSYSDKEISADSSDYAKSILQEIFDIFPETDYVIQEDDDGEYKKTDSPYKTAESLAEPLAISDPYSVPHYNVTNVENMVNRLDPVSMNKVRFKHDGFSEVEITNIGILMGEYVKNYNDIYQECLDICRYINKKTHQNIRIKMNIKVSRSDCFTTL